ncbi:MAG: hypothetical protein NDI84_01785 [Steroidobacteraceae bacterium]|nr:hypothetical protein [Steroidobacteraceae bacterium]
MKSGLACAALVTVLTLGGASIALADDGCGMNSNKPCPEKDKLSSKEPAYKSMNSNKPAAQQNSSAPARTDVKTSGKEQAAAKATLTGVSASDLKVKPKPEKTSEKEPAE